MPNVPSVRSSSSSTLPRSFTRAGIITLALALLLGSCGSDAAKSPLSPAPRGLAIVSSDFTATSVALYDPLTQSLVDDCVASGGGLTEPLSGDVTLPTRPQHNGELMLIDRKNAVLTAVTPSSCSTRLQFSVSTGGFKGNPHDVISVSDTKAYVTRYEKNGAPTDDPGDFDDGDDVLVVNPSTGAILKSISLAGQVPTGSDPSVQARPDRGVLVGDKVYVTLGNLGPFSAGAIATAHGRVVVIDTATDTVSSVIDLPAQKGCSAIDQADAPRRLYVACWGAQSDGPAQTASSALVEIDLSKSPSPLARTLGADMLGAQPLNFSSAAVLGDTAFVSTLGSFPDAMAGTPGTADVFYAASLNGGDPVKLFEESAYNLGRVAVDAATKHVFVPDGSAAHPLIRIFDASVAPVVAGDTFEPNPAGHLPPREIAWY